MYNLHDLPGLNSFKLFILLQAGSKTPCQKKNGKEKKRKQTRRTQTCMVHNSAAEPIEKERWNRNIFLFLDINM